MSLSSQQIIEILSHHNYPAFESYGHNFPALIENSSDEDTTISFENVLKDFELTEEQKQTAQAMSIKDQRQ